MSEEIKNEAVSEEISSSFIDDFIIEDLAEGGRCEGISTLYLRCSMQERACLTLYDYTMLKWSCSKVRAGYPKDAATGLLRRTFLGDWEKAMIVSCFGGKSGIRL